MPLRSSPRTSARIRNLDRTVSGGVAVDIDGSFLDQVVMHDVVPAAFRARRHGGTAGGTGCTNISM